MEIVIIEPKTLQKMEALLEQLENTIGRVVKNRIPRMEKWVDNEYVCLALKITKRTLQSHRENGLLSYTRVRHKVLYKHQDIEKFILRGHESNNPDKSL